MMINDLCCTTDRDVLRDSMLDVGPKMRRSFIEEETRSSVCSDLSRPRKPLKHRLVKIERNIVCRGRSDMASQSSFLSNRKLSQESSQASGALRLEEEDEREQLLARLQQRNRELRRIMAEEVVPLEEEYVRLFVENRRKGQLIELIGERLSTLEAGNGQGRLVDP